VNALVAAALEIETQWRQAGWKACIIGGLAVLRWGEPRTARITTCGCEDLLVLKAFAGREKDWLDVEGIVARQRGRIDARLVYDELAQLIELKGSIDTKQRLEKLLPS